MIGGFRLSSYFPFGSTYQINHLVHPFCDLDVSNERYGHPRDAMVDYRNNVKRSMGKVHLTLASHSWLSLLGVGLVLCQTAT